MVAEPLPGILVETDDRVPGQLRGLRWGTPRRDHRRDPDEYDRDEPDEREPDEYDLLDPAFDLVVMVFFDVPASPPARPFPAEYFADFAGLGADLAA